VNLQEQIRALHDELGTTIVLTTHYLEEADAIAGRVIVIDHGVVIADDSADRLKSSLGDLVSLGFESERDAAAGAERAQRIDGAAVTLTGTDLAVRVAHGRDLATSLVTDLAWSGVLARRIEVVGPTLDDVFLELTGRSLRESNESPTEPDASGVSTEGAAA
jgi:ABC-2 type transport system ATP-binding protein